MAHELATTNGEASMAYFGETPWHRLGTQLNEPATAAEAIQAAGLDYKADLKPLQTADGTSVPQRKAVIRSDTGGCLLKQERFAEAIEFLRKAIDASPKDVQSMIGLGQALEQVGKSDDADEIYEKVIKQGGPQSMLDLAKERRTAIAHDIMRKRGGGFRPDVMMYISGALEKFSSMSASQIQNVGFEIAILGQSGLDINDPSKKYTIKSIPGEYTGLHLCSIMYAAFKEFAPGEDVGIDFSREYEAAGGK